jgi:5-methylcytosine-specific restriction endonuclease McrA
MCGRLVRLGREAGPAQAIGDHIRSHDGDPERFFDPENVQTLCKACHDGPKQSAEKGGG